MNKITQLLFAALTALAAAPAHADMTPKHVAVAMKAIRFVTPTINSGDKAVFVYRDGDSASQAVAEELAGSVSGGTLTPVTTSTSALDLSSGRMVFVTDAALSNIAAIEGAAAGQQSIIISAQSDCSASGQCVLSVATSPKVQIHLSTDAADKAGVSFSNAFMMLVKKH